MTDASGRHCRRSQAPKPTPKTMASAANCPGDAARGEKKAVEFPSLPLGAAPVPGPVNSTTPSRVVTSIFKALSAGSAASAVRTLALIAVSSTASAMRLAARTVSAVALPTAVPTANLRTVWCGTVGG